MKTTTVADEAGRAGGPSQRLIPGAGARQELLQRFNLEFILLGGEIVHKRYLHLALAISCLISTATVHAQTYKEGNGLTGVDKLGAHQNGGRGCVGCHIPHSGSRGNGGALSLQEDGSYASVPAVGDVGNDALWGQDVGQIYNTEFDFPANPDDNTRDGKLTITKSSPRRQITGVALCLSCHDGNVAKGAMMANKSFEQSAGLLPAGYGTASIPTLLGADGGSAGNYKNDHPVGPSANLGAVGHGAINSAKGFFTLAIQGGQISRGPSFTGSAMEEFYKNYGLPSIVDALPDSGWATDVSANLDDAYVVCSTCHNVHSMYTYGSSPNVYPTFFFVAAPYNPGANVADGTKASSAAQFCRQCHFSGPGGSNEASGISIPTAY